MRFASVTLLDGVEPVYLKSLSMRGFKSFASATTLVFEPGISCVVGPNGSGKSNVVDALAWVMGEQGAKSLRGGKMEDVIFAGTAGRSPLGRAEVVLTIDNTDGALPIDYTEVTISRTLFRNGGSEYAINGSPARLLDVQELLSDSGIGREMHVVVGQGQLDSILQATPETRRGFIEEAAGVLKHRKRKEKAERKLESTGANLNRLNDLLAEIRRQLKPLGRQAEVARRAAEVQAELRDAKARLLADDLTRASQALADDLAAESRIKERRLQLEEELASARQAEADAEAAARDELPRLTSAQETWYSLAGLSERLNSTITIAAERLRTAEAIGGEESVGRDPEAIEREAASVREAQESLRLEVETRQEALDATAAAREAAESALAGAEQRYAAQQRAIADRREGLARLAGEVGTLESRVEAATAEIERLGAARAQAEQRCEDARSAFAKLETRLAGLSAGESGLDAAYEAAEEHAAQARDRLEQLLAAEQAALADRAAAAARTEALALGLERRDASAALLAAGDRLNGLLGSVAALIEVPAGMEVAIATALGSAADAVAVTGMDAALTAFDHLKTEDLGRVGLLLGGAQPDPGDWPELPQGAVYAAEVVNCAPALRGAVQRLLFKVAVVADLDRGRDLVAELPDLRVVTAEGDLLSSWFAAGGSASDPSVLEVQKALQEARARLVEAEGETDRLRFQLGAARRDVEQAEQAAEAALAVLHDSDAQHAALAEEAGELNQAIRAATAEAGRLAAAAEEAAQARDEAIASLGQLQSRLDLAAAHNESSEADPSERDRCSDQATVARSAEMEARLALRTVEERARALAGRFESLTRAAQAERSAQAEAAARREQMRRDAEVAAAVGVAAGWLAEMLAASRAAADAERVAAQERRHAAEVELGAARQRGRELAMAFEGLVDTAHRDELARAQQQMRIDSITERAMLELGLEPEALVAEYGPEVPVPVLVGESGQLLQDHESRPEPVPYDRGTQEKRLRAAERDLETLGRVNPLALEEFEALSQRHGFLAEQLADLRKTREDLTGIIAEVDARVQEVFAAAFVDVAKAFEDTFSRLFPGGEGRLVLTEPDQMLTSGVEVEARPAGKRVKRLSLLSGGERSLVAVAFLVALFKARPSPFYILDEVEAALDDTNLGRLLEIYQELRSTSQLLVITHQKRTMELADVLYGVTMRSDGVSKVISQRMNES